MCLTQPQKDKADFILLSHKTAQVLESNNQTHWTLCKAYTHTLKYRFQVICLNQVKSRTF